MDEVGIRRNRGAYFFLLISTIVLGLSSRKFPGIFPKFFVEYAGDTLYAVMIFILTGLVQPRMSTLRTGLFSLAFCYLVETSQLFHFEWLAAIRKYKIGGLILGYGFLWSDIACYTFGIISSAILEILYFRKKCQG